MENTRPRAVWNPVDRSLKDLKQFEEDWVIVAVRLVPERWYGIWYDRNDNDIEKVYGVRVTHWKPIENYEIGVYHL